MFIHLPFRVCELTDVHPLFERLESKVGLAKPLIQFYPLFPNDGMSKTK